MSMNGEDKESVNVDVQEGSNDEIPLKLPDKERKSFQSTAGIVTSCLGSAVGTGNVWRFPRIVATHSYSQGSLTFYIAWIILLFFWSMPVIMVEYALGRFTRNSPPVFFMKFLGKRYIWVGGWLVVTIFFLSSYYPVIIGWCLYYLYVSCTAPSLPNDEASGLAIFNGFVQDTYFSILTQLLSVAITGALLFGGIRWIEKANLVLVPTLLAIILFTLGWSLTREYADVGIVFLFTPTWTSFMLPGLWIAAAGQNAFDTGAGMSLLSTYATFMGRSSGIVRYTIFIPMINNMISFYASIMLFSTVFSTLISLDGTITRSAILIIIQTTGPGSTGLTFTWIPVIFSNVGIIGRVLCVLFFLCLTFAGISSLISEIQVYIIVLKDFGIPHRIAVSVSLIACAICGVPSAINLKILENQDNTWGYALIISGSLLALLVIIYNPFRFRRVLINDFGIGDWRAPVIWVPIISILVPFQAVALIVWWIYDYVRTDPLWYHITLSSITATIIEWCVAVVILISANFIYLHFAGNRPILQKARLAGCDPYDETTYAPQYRASEQNIPSVIEVEIGTRPSTPSAD